jgi:hypothetical protein
LNNVLYSPAQSPPGEIWYTAEQVYVRRDHSRIHFGFMLAYLVAKKVIARDGTNTFLQKQEFHSRVREDFYNTQHGVAKKTRVVC